jgi:hypothetical protein
MQCGSMTTAFNSSLLPGKRPDGVVRSCDHPLQRMERAFGITAEEAASRLRVSLRQYRRYKSVSADLIPERVLLLIELGAMERPLVPLSIKERIQEWISLNRS